MNCNELVEKVTDYLDGALPQEDQVRWQQHVAVCVGCVGHLDEVDTMLGLMSSIEPEPIDCGLEDNLVSIYRQWSERVGT
jgi:hypothetical protein